jgi:predicted transposase YbfD/YdcC
MARIKRKSVSPEEQTVLDRLQIRPLTRADEIARCDELIVAEHYLHDATLVGEQLRYVATFKGQWLAVATWSAAAFHLKARDQFIGWTPEQCRRRRPLLANNSRLLVLADCHYPNLISRFMRLMLARLSQDWQAHWGHPLAMVESFVDPQRFQGTAYKVSGWSHLGRTAGWKRDAADFYLKHDAPKQIWVRELVKKACVKLRAPELPAEWTCAESDLIPRCRVQAREIRSLMAWLRQELVEFRRPQALAYPLAGMIALIVMAMATGVRKGPDDLAQYADTLSQGQLRALRFRAARGTGRIRCPKKTVFHTVLNAVAGAVLEGLLLRWQEQVLGPVQDRVVIVDGKKMRHGGVEMVNAVSGAGRFLGGVITEAKSNEIPAARVVLRQLDLAGKTVLADALHTNVETAQQILYEQGGDYVMTVKGNQPTLRKTLEDLFTQRAFSPSAELAHANHPARGQLRTGGDPQPGLPRSDAQPDGLSGSSAGGALANAGAAQRRMERANCLPVEQPHPG